MHARAHTAHAPARIDRAQRRGARSAWNATRVPVSTSRSARRDALGSDVDVGAGVGAAMDAVHAVPYVPSPMDQGQLANEFVVLGAIAGMTAYWWFVLVPSARVRLASNKRSGALRTYLEELKSDDSKDRDAERWFYAQWLSKIDPETRYLLREDAGAAGDETTTTTTTATATKPTTRLDDTNGGGVRGKEPSLEEIMKSARKTPKFWSLDNPVLVGTMLSVGAAAILSGGPPH